MNKVFLLGRLGDYSEIRYTLDGKPVASFRIATNEVIVKNGIKETLTEWHRIVTFGRLAELCGERLHKGARVFIEGKLRTRSFEDRNGQLKKVTEVWAEKILFLNIPPSRSFEDRVTGVGETDNLKTCPLIEEDIPF